MKLTAIGRSRRFVGGKLKLTEVEMNVEIDVRKLANYYAGKLARSKSGVSVIQNGAIVAKTVRKKETEL